MNQEIYVMELDETIPFSQYESFLEWLSEEKRERITRFYFDIHKKLSLAADLLVRELACRYTGIPKPELTFLQNAYGKPSLAGVKNFHYNISHTCSAVAVAVADYPTGIDIEKITEYDKSIAMRFFSEKEKEYIEKDESGAAARFFEIWTKKEAYVKWKGTGLSIPLDSFDVMAAKLPCFFTTLEKNGYQISACAGDRTQFEVRCVSEKWLYERL